MASLPYTPVEMTAIDGSRGVHRRWSVIAYRDLFGALLVETRWGRCGCVGRTLIRCFPNEAAAGRYVSQLLARRRSAVKRIGVGYALRNAARGDLETNDTNVICVDRA